MVGIAHIAKYHEAYKVALHLHRVYSDLDAAALLIIFAGFERLIVPLMDEVSPDWKYSGNLGRHMNFLKRNLERGSKNSSAADAFDIVYYDMPILGDYLIAGWRGLAKLIHACSRQRTDYLK